jgi:hypothetical protein
MFLTHATRGFLLLITSSSLAFAQTLVAGKPEPSPTPTPTEIKPVDPETEKAALELLRGVIKDADGFKLADNRFALKHFTASILWRRDPEKARSLHRGAAAAWLQWAGSLDPEDLTPRNIGYRFMNLRRQFLQDVAERDAVLSLELFRQTSASLSPALLDALNYKPNAERDLELALVSRLAGQDAGEMLKLAREHLTRYGVSSSLVNLVKTLKERDRAKAAELGAAIVAALQGEDLRVKSELRGAALELWQASLPDAAAKSKIAAQGELLLETSDFRALSEQLATALERRLSDEDNSNDDSLASALEAQLPLLEKYANGAALRVRREMRKRGRNTRVATPDAPAAATAEPANNVSKLQARIEKATLEEALDILRDTPEDQQYQLYGVIGGKIEQAEDPERARSLVAAKMPNLYFKETLLAQLDNRILQTTAAKGDVEKLRSYLATIRNEDKRYTALIQSAAVIAQKDRAVAVRLLDEALPIVNQPARTVTKMTTQALLLRAYAEVEPKKALDLLETMASRADELIPAALAVAEFAIETEAVENDEFRLSVFLDGPAERLLPFELVNTLKILARHDFTRLRNIAGRFQRPEARALAQMLVIVSVLDMPGQQAKDTP